MVAGRTYEGEGGHQALGGGEGPDYAKLLEEERARNNAHAKAMHDFVAVSQLCEKQGHV